MGSRAVRGFDMLPKLCAVHGGDPRKHEVAEEG
jgi:hypothetical protein